MKNVKILFRKSLDEEGEFEICQDIFGKENVIESRMLVSPNDLVVGRYSVLPFYNEFENDLEIIDAGLINTYQQHQLLADLRQWYPYLKDETPKTWWNAGYRNVPDTPNGYIIKGATNSRKHQWKERMFAPDRDQLEILVNRFYDDQMLVDQGLIIREYVPLETYELAINDMPITNEWRFFVYKDKILSHGYYWSYYDDPPEVCEGYSYVENLINKVWSEHNDIWPNFWVIDIAKTQKGDWIVIELNEGQMSGLSLNDPKEMYTALHTALYEEQGKNNE